MLVSAYRKLGAGNPWAGHSKDMESDSSSSSGFCTKAGVRGAVLEMGSAKSGLNCILKREVGAVPDVGLGAATEPT